MTKGTAYVFVAPFIGSPSMNLLPVSVNGRGVEKNAGNHWVVPGAQGAIGYALTLGVGPEHLRLDDAKSDCRPRLW